MGVVTSGMYRSAVNLGMSITEKMKKTGDISLSEISRKGYKRTVKAG